MGAVMNPDAAVLICRQLEAGHRNCVNSRLVARIKMAFDPLITLTCRGQRRDDLSSAVMTIGTRRTIPSRSGRCWRATSRRRLLQLREISHK